MNLRFSWGGQEQWHLKYLKHLSSVAGGFHPHASNTAASGFDKESIQDLFEKYLLENFAGQAGIWSGKRRNVTAEADKEYSAHNMDHKMRSQQT